MLCALFTFKHVTKYFIKKGSEVYCAFLDASKAFDKVLHNGLFVKLLRKMCLFGLYVFCRTGIVNCARPFSGMVLSAMFLLFSVGYDKVEFYHLCCSVYIYR